MNSSDFNWTNNTSVSMLQDAQSAYLGIFDALSTDTIFIVVSVVVLALVAGVFTVARLVIAVLRASDDAANAELRMVELRERNMKIQEELNLNQLNQKQLNMIRANKDQIEAHIPVMLQLELDYHELKFEERLGSGSFGDCYKGVFGERLVAVKRMVSFERNAIQTSNKPCTFS